MRRYWILSEKPILVTQFTSFSSAWFCDSFHDFFYFRLSLLEDLQQQWPQAFLQSSSWDWPLLRTTCYKMLSSDDLNTVRLEEQEMEARELSSNFTTTGNVFVTHLKRLTYLFLCC